MVPSIGSGHAAEPLTPATVPNIGPPDTAACDRKCLVKGRGTRRGLQIFGALSLVEVLA
jgi:hypothetical protein